MAPEQAHRQPLGPATDVFGLGVVLYQLLTGGARPYRLLTAEAAGGRRTAPGQRVLDSSASPAPPSAANHRVTPGLDQVTLRAIDPRPLARFQTVAEFRRALETAA